MEDTDVQAIVKQAIQEFLQEQQAKSEPAYKTELVEERKRREQLERRLNEVEEESKRSRQAAEQAERSAAIRAELQRLGVAKIDLAYRAVHDGVFRTEDGRLLAHSDEGEVPLKEYLTNFVSENPEFLPARISGRIGDYRGAQGATGRHRERGHRRHPARNERGTDGAGAERDSARRFAELATGV